jgi:beta-galactosidase
MTFTLPTMRRQTLIHLLSLVALFAPLHELSAQAPPPPAKHVFEIGSEQFLIDGKKLVIRCGELHFARIPPEYWRHGLKMAKAMGLNTVCAYFFWNFHEWEEGKFDWTGWRDAAEF